MLKEDYRQLAEEYAAFGWILEPAAKELLGRAGIKVPAFVWAADESEALSFADRVGYPVVAKVVSPEILHKSEAGGVIAGIATPGELRQAVARLSGFPGSRGVLVEETASGLELILGAKCDQQFGPVIMAGIGGTGVEIYQDTAIRMAPLDEGQAEAMLDCLQGRELLRGHRGSPGVDMAGLIDCLVRFSRLIMELEPIMESIDVNPLMCSQSGCTAADARIMLRGEEEIRRA
jgi:succinyl-CoA synthetase beta subunit